jgi:dTDP-4-dehydrorhamnose 3,5-epimerase
MHFHSTHLQDAVLIELEKREDSRGYFARMFCKEEFAAAGLATDFVQHNCSFNHVEGTLRGLHFQNPPHREIKVVQCVRGAIHDVIVDLRPESPTYMQWQGFDLTESNQRQIYVPEGFAHGYVTLQDNSAVSYLVSMPYAPGAEAGVRWNDAALSIAWPVEILRMSDKDSQWPDYIPER